MATTMTLIGKQTVGANGAASVTFSNIPQTYTDLKIVSSIRTGWATDNNDQFQMQINGDTASNYPHKFLMGNGSGVDWDGGTPNSINPQAQTSSSTASTFGSFEYYIPNYTSSNQKSINMDGVTENNGTAVYTQLGAYLWTGTSAITTLLFKTSRGVGFVEGSTFYLYGISSNVTTQNTTVPYAYGGDVITTDGSYWYHTFLYSGTFVPQKALTCDLLVVAGGGGGGGGNGGGGGGAGGLLGFTAQSLTSATSYTCTVGAAGPAGGSNASGTQGGNSQFGSLTTVIGGGKGDGGGYGAGLGGSGGGAYPGNTGGANTSGQGNVGGNGVIPFTSPYPSGGGGGAGAAGANGVGSQSGAGGIGSSAYSSWGLATTTGQNVTGTVYFAGGGGGSSTSQGAAAGAGGYGGGGAGNANFGLANTGGGGAGGGNITAGGNGGSGIIIVRYAI